ncbi:MAG TPA: dTDP-Rha--alpha-D-GlcNAc-pyrophosphate polyprenol alpha-3-L-rhamnosyltransferase [Cytophagales bacterium]|nr:dTDP-Rha--alpha-D-GlcNAc-pyrophosphate polyprenol alpha-3-L-rhamnosyltransferase [Cytophagales bacterium]
MTSAAVVILNYNGRHYLEQFLPSVIRYSSPAQVVVIDNGSTADSVAWLSAHAASVSCIRLNQNLGFSGGYNAGLHQVKADYVVLLNSDVEVTENWLQPLVAHLNNNPDMAAVQPKIKSFHQRTNFEYAGAAGGFLDAFGYPFCRGRIFDKVEEDRGQYNDSRPVMWGSGACLAIRAKAYWHVGGLDEHFFAHMEEIDLCWRFHRAGYQVWYNAQSEVFHVGGGTLSAANPRKTYLNFTNSLAMLAKNLPVAPLVMALLGRVVLDGFACLLFLSRGQAPHAAAVVKAYWQFVSNLARVWRERQAIAKRFPLLRVPHQMVLSIAWTFFVLRQQRFSETIARQ